jgi:uncharacterized protein
MSATNLFLLDASALVKRYIAEKGSALIDHLFVRSSKDRLSSSMLGLAEVGACLIRKRNSAIVTTATFGSAFAAMVADTLDAADFTKWPADNALIRAAITLLDKHPINSADGVLLQIALEANTIEQGRNNAIVLVSSDQRLVKAAQAEGLMTFDPEAQTQADVDKLIGP